MARIGFLAFFLLSNFVGLKSCAPNQDYIRRNNPCVQCREIVVHSNCSSEWHNDISFCSTPAINYGSDASTGCAQATITCRLDPRKSTSQQLVMIVALIENGISDEPSFTPLTYSTDGVATIKQTCGMESEWIRESMDHQRLSQPLTLQCAHSVETFFLTLVNQRAKRFAVESGTGNGNQNSNGIFTRIFYEYIIPAFIITLILALFAADRINRIVIRQTKTSTAQLLRSFVALPLELSVIKQKSTSQLVMIMALMESRVGSKTYFEPVTYRNRRVATLSTWGKESEGIREWIFRSMENRRLLQPLTVHCAHNADTDIRVVGTTIILTMSVLFKISVRGTF
ncbi:hypothetical protein M3Y98_01136600 [Aphelenchoides besseyi]|nr:hypothetical protein M3Y98_01136600 [Aphelenchoides besseyi]KAI6210641.1 hypothetical protein M3Y96_00349500 [Aphelenchoides besseyi]